MNLNPSKIGSMIKSNHCLGTGAESRVLDSSNNNNSVISNSEQEDIDKDKEMQTRQISDASLKPVIAKKVSSHIIMIYKCGHKIRFSESLCNSDRLKS